MRGEVFKNTLWRSLRAAIIWGIVMAFFANYVILLTPDAAGLQGFIGLFNAMPPVVMQAFGITDINAMATPEGFLGIAFFTYASVTLAIYAVLAGLSVTANDEEQGIMNMLLSLPLPRWTLIVERVLAHTVLTALVCLMCYAGVVAGTRINPVLSEVNLLYAAQAVGALIPFVMAIFGITLLLGVVIRRRAIAGAVAGVFVALSFMLNTLGGGAGPELGPVLQGLSVFNYYDGGDAMLNGLNWVPTLAMGVIAVILTLVSVRLYERRDISG
jgi:ABC-2 type transport system permease protein